MRIESLSIREGMSAKTFRFCEGRTLICSEKRNSVGKTTLIRCLLYSLGEDVPGTHRFRMKKHSTRVIVVNDQGARLKLIREDASIRIIDLETAECDSYSLPYNLREVKARVFGTDTPELAENLLGTYYIDQDKGWTLLNRGNPISRIHFSIEELLRGLSGTDCTQLLLRSRSLAEDIDKYSFIVKAAGYQDKVTDEPGVSEMAYNPQRDYERLAELRMQEISLRKRILAIRKAQKDNERFVDHVATMGLRVKLPGGGEVRVTTDNLVDYDDTRNYLEGEALALNAERSEVLEQMQLMEAQIAEQDTLFHADKSSLTFDRQLAGMKLDVGSYEKALESLREQKAAVDRQLQAMVSNGKPAFDTMTKYALEYCGVLGIEKLFQSDPKGILTSELKSKSGTNRHLLVFAFRMAYASTLYDIKGIRVPLIIDSIRSDEINDDNLNKCLTLLDSFMSKHQQIIATIDSDGIDSNGQIIIKNAMFDDSEVVKDIASWEDGE